MPKANRKKKQRTKPLKITKDDANSPKQKKPAEAKHNLVKILKIVGISVLVGLLTAFFYFIGAYFLTNRVTVLTDASFDQAIGDNPLMLVDFHAPYCGHCQRLERNGCGHCKDFMEKVAYEVGKKIKFARIDSTANFETVVKYRVRGYPTTKFFKNGRVLDVDFSRESVEDFVEYLKALSGPAVVEIESRAQFDKIKEDHSVFMLGYFPHIVNEAFKNVAEKNLAESGKATFFSVSDPELAEKLALKSDQVSVFKKSERVKFKGSPTKASLSSFAFKNYLPLLSQLNEDTARHLLKGDLNAKHAVVFISGDSEDYEDVIEDFEKAAEEMKESELVFSYADVNSEIIKTFNEHFKLGLDVVPVLRIFYFENGTIRKFKPDVDKVTAESMIEFSRKYLSGKAKTFYFSDKIPLDWNKGAVKVLVGDNFKQVAFDESKKIFVWFYHPKSKTTEILDPVWQQLGEKHEGIDDVIVAKMDVTSNDADDFEVESAFMLIQKDGTATSYPVSFSLLKNILLILLICLQMIVFILFGS